MDKKQTKAFSKSFVSNQSLNSSSFTKLPDGSVKRKRQKASYKDIYLEKQNFIPTQMPLSNHRNGNYSTLYNNSMIINMSHDNSNYSIKTDDNDDITSKKDPKQMKKNSSGSYSQRKKHAKTKSLNINTSNSMYQSTTNKKGHHNMKDSFPIMKGESSVKNQIRAGINLLNISNRSQSINRSLNNIELKHDNNDNDNGDKILPDTITLKDEMNILQSLAVDTFRERNKKMHSHSFTCPKTLMENDIMIQFLYEKGNEEQQLKKTNLRKSFEIEGITIKSTYVNFGGIQGLNGLLESIEPKKEFGMIDRFISKQFMTKKIRHEKFNSNCHNVDNLILGSLIENDREGDYEQLEAMTNTLGEAISKQNSLKEKCNKDNNMAHNNNKDFDLDNEKVINHYSPNPKNEIGKITTSFDKDEEEKDDKEECIVIKGESIAKEIAIKHNNNDIPLSKDLINHPTQDKEDLIVISNIHKTPNKNEDNHIIVSTNLINEKFDVTKEENQKIDSNIDNKDGDMNENKVNDQEVNSKNRSREARKIHEIDINNPRLIDISPDKKHNQEETNSSFNKEAETEYNNPGSTNSKNTPTDQDKPKIESKPLDYEDQEYNNNRNNKIIFNNNDGEESNKNQYIINSNQLKQQNQSTSSLKNKSSERYDNDNDNDNESNEENNKIVMTEDKETVEQQIEELNKINESLKVIQETIEQNQRKTNDKTSTINEEDQNNYSNKKKQDIDNKQINLVISEFKITSLAILDENQENIQTSSHNDKDKDKDIIEYAKQSKTLKQQIEKSDNSPVNDGKNDDFIIVNNSNNQLANSKNNEMLMSNSQNPISNVDNEENNELSQEEDQEDEEGEERCTNNYVYSSQNIKQLNYQKNALSPIEDRLTTEQRDEENNMEISLSISQSDHENNNENVDDINNEKDNGYYPSPDKIHKLNPNIESDEIVKTIQEPYDVSNSYHSPNKTRLKSAKGINKSPNEDNTDNVDNKEAFEVIGPKKVFVNNDDEQEKEGDDGDNNDQDEDTQFRNYYYKHRDEIEEVDEDCEESFKRSVGTNLFNTQPNHSNEKEKQKESKDKEVINHRIKVLLDNFYSEENDNSNKNKEENTNENNALKLQRLNNMKKLLSNPQTKSDLQNNNNSPNNSSSIKSQHLVDSNLTNKNLKEQAGLSSSNEIKDKTNIQKEQQPHIQQQQVISSQEEMIKNHDLKQNQVKNASSFEISNIRIAIAEDTKSQANSIKTPSTIALTKEESFNVVGKSPQPIPNEVKQFTIENLSFNIKQQQPPKAITNDNTNLNNDNYANEINKINQIKLKRNLSKDNQLCNNNNNSNEEEYKIFTANKLNSCSQGKDGLNSDDNPNNNILGNLNDNGVNNEIDSFINKLKAKNKTKEGNLASLLTEKEKELKYLKERKGFFIKQKQLNQEKRTISNNNDNYKNKDIYINNDSNDQNNQLEPHLAKLLNKAPILFANNHNPPQNQNPLSFITNNPDTLSNQNTDIKTAPIMNEIIQKKEVYKSHKSIFQNEQNNNNASTSSNKMGLKSEQKMNMNDLMLLGDENSKHNKVSSFFDFEGFNSNSKREKERDSNQEKKLIEKKVYLNKVKEDLKQTEHTKRLKETNTKLNQNTQANRNKYSLPNNLIMPANSLEDVLETKDLFFFGKS